MKVAFVSYLHGFGGAEKQNIMLANALSEKGHEVTLIAVSTDNICYDIDEQIKQIFIPDRKTNALRIITRYNDIKRILKVIRPNVTISFWFQSAYLTAMMRKKIVGQVIYSERGDPGDKEYKGILGIIRKMVLPRIDGFVFQSRGAQEYFNCKVQKKSVVIPNPVFVNAKAYPKGKERRKVIVTVGRLHPQKNQRLLIDAFAAIADHIPEYKLEIYGDGDLREELQTRINQLGLRERVFLKGTSDEIHKLIFDASLFVLSSDYEGIPNTLLEAMALGIPCIATDCRPGGARELIDDGESGIIVPVNDTKRLSDAIELMLNKEPKELLMYSIKAQKKAKEYIPAIIFSKWEEYMLAISQG